MRNSIYHPQWHYPTICTGTDEAEDHCGRALGIQFSQENPDVLYVADCAHGLRTVNVKTGHTHLVVPKRNSRSGNIHYCANFVNDLVVLPNGSVLFTDSSKKFSRRDNRMEALECRGNGQLLQYNPTDDSVHVLVDGLHFPNGMCLSADGNSVLIVETTRARILRWIHVQRMVVRSSLKNTISRRLGNMHRVCSRLL